MKRRSIPMEELYPLLQAQMEAGGQCLLPVTGSSMLPALRQGRDTVVLRRPAALRKGDVVLYRRADGRFILHRIIRREGRGFFCCGDNQFTGEYVESGQILAAVTAVVRGERKRQSLRLGWRLWGWIWTALFPVRRPLIRLRRLLGKVKRIGACQKTAR